MGKNALGEYALDGAALALTAWVFERRGAGTLLRTTDHFEKSVPAGDTVSDTPPPLQPPVDPAGAAPFLRGLLEGGRLDALGPKKLGVVRAKLEQHDHGWLFQLARSRELYGLLGLLPGQKAD